MSERYVVPLTEEERIARQRVLTNSKPRKAKLSADAKTMLWLAVALNIGAIAVTLYAAWKEGWL